jgi:hypothetical protein
VSTALRVQRAGRVEDPGLARLRAHLRRHNRRVLGITLLTLSVTVVLWVVLYGAVWWFFLLGSAATRPLDYHPREWPVMRNFAIGAVMLCVIAWMVRRMRPNEAPADHKSVWEHAMDVLLALPRLTLALMGTGLAAARLREPELEYAWDILQRLREQGKPVPVAELPIGHGDERMRERVLMALQVSDVIEIRPGDTGPMVRFRDDEARMIAETWVQLHR